MGKRLVFAVWVDEWNARMDGWPSDGLPGLLNKSTAKGRYATITGKLLRPLQMHLQGGEYPHEY